MTLTFRQKLFLPLLLSWICLLVVAAINIKNVRDTRLEERKIQISNAGDMAESIFKQYDALSASGALSLDEAKKQALASIKALRYGKNGYITMFDSDKVLMHPMKPELAGTRITEMRDSTGRQLYIEAIQAAAATGHGFTEYTWVRPGEKVAVPKLGYNLTYKPWGWTLQTGLYIDDLDDAFYANLRDAGLLLVVIGALLSGIVLVLVRSVQKSLGGDPGVAAAVAQRIAAGDLSVEVQVGAGDDASLMASMRAMRDALAGIVSQVRTGTDLIATASSEIANGNLDLSARTEQQAGSLEETASSMEELTSAVRQSAENARDATVLAGSASEVAGRGGEIVAKVVETMEAINLSSGKIVDIISVIDGIAFQTNILALNAAVEAARAGEQGRGFAVVASEVRTLAQRSAAAAKEIKVLIGDSVARIDAGAHLVAEAGSTMQEIVARVSQVSSMIAGISSATQEQGAGIEHINQAIAHMDQTTQQNAALVEEAAAASGAMQDQTARLAQVVSVFKVDAHGGAAPGKAARQLAISAR